MRDLEQQIYAIFYDLGVPSANTGLEKPYVVEAKDKLLTLFEQLDKSARIDELEKLSERQETFVGYGYDSIGVDISHIDDRLESLKHKEK